MKETIATLHGKHSAEHLGKTEGAAGFVFTESGSIGYIFLFATGEVETVTPHFCQTMCDSQIEKICRRMKKFSFLDMEKTHLLFFCK